MTVVAHIKNSAPKGSAKKQQIKERKCILKQDGVPTNHTVINLNHPQLLGPGSVGDFIFASDAIKDSAPWDKSWVVAIELTGGSKSATKVRDQLNAATGVVKKLTNDNMEFDFRRVFAFGGKMHKIDRDRLKQEKIKFRGNSVGIRLVRCGSPLYKVLLSRESGG